MHPPSSNPIRRDCIRSLFTGSTSIIIEPTGSTLKTSHQNKIKNNKNRTVKKRMLVNEMNKHLGQQEENLVSEIIGLQP
ncbi:MAG: hypothetical protein QF774_15515, partial [Nitrospinota bacterium]|nr:hypothetical protein [Nitrospinota bacterium]